jgi:hypothetical protein
VDLTNFWGRLAEEAWHRLGEATPANRIRILQDILRARANGRSHLVREFKAFSGLPPVDYRDAAAKPRKDVGFLQDTPARFGPEYRLNLAVAEMKFVNSP